MLIVSILGFLFLVASAPIYVFLPLLYLPLAFINALTKPYR